MQPFEFETPTKIKITPNQAHKILDKLKVAINDAKYNTDDNLTNFTLNKAQVSDVDIQSIKLSLQNKFYERYRYSKLLLEYSTDLFNTKEKLFSFNIQHKISQKLSQIDILKQQIKYYTLFQEHISATDANSSDELLRRGKNYLESNEDVTHIDIEILFYDSTEAKIKLQKAKKEILKLENEITLINASNEIELELSQSSIEYIGLG